MTNKWQSRGNSGAGPVGNPPAYDAGAPQISGPQIGDISELEARSARSNAARVEVLRRAAEHDRDLARLTLAGLVGLPADDRIRPVRIPARTRRRCSISSSCRRFT